MLTTPRWMMTHAQYITFKSLIALGAEMTLTDDLGVERTVKFAGKPKVTIEDTPDRGTLSERYLVDVPLVQVA